MIKINEKLLCDKYLQKTPMKKLVKEFNISEMTIYNILNKNNIGRVGPNKKYTLNENYFAKVDNQYKTYFLGLLYADGCNYKNKEIILKLIETDSDIIDVFNKQIESNRPIVHKKGTINIIKGKQYLSQPQKILRIKNKQFASNLSKLGCVPNKTKTLTFPNCIPNYLMSHFIRGYLDGDGCIHVRVKNGASISFSGNKEFLLGLNEYIQNNLGIRMYFTKEKRSSILCISSTGSIPNIKKLGDWIYKDATVFLQRKKDKYDLFITKCFNNYHSSNNTKSKMFTI